MYLIEPFNNNEQTREKTAKKAYNTISLERFEQMTLGDIVTYFSSYKKLKAFCRSLNKISQKKMIVLITDDDEITADNENIIKQNLLNYMRLPTETSSKNPEVIQKYLSFSNDKYKRLMIVLTIIKKKLKQKNENINE